MIPPKQKYETNIPKTFLANFYLVQYSVERICNLSNRTADFGAGYHPLAFQMDCSAGFVCAEYCCRRIWAWTIIS